MKSFQKWGGAAALIDAATYLVAMGLFYAVLSPFAGQDLEIGQFVAQAAPKQTLVFVWNVTSYFINGIFLVILMLALEERLKAYAPGLIRVATLFGLIWAGLVFAAGLIDIYSQNVIFDLYARSPAQAGMVKQAIDIVTLGINSSDRLLGGGWLLLTGWAALRSSQFPKGLNLIAITIGAVSLISTLFPGLREPGTMVFGLGILVWWVWQGIVLLRGHPGERVEEKVHLPKAWVEREGTVR